MTAYPDIDPSLLERNNRAGLVHFAGHLGLIALSATALTLAEGHWTWAPLVLVHGILLVFLFAPLHETIHGTAFRTTALNRIAGLVTGFVIFLPPRFFRAFHMAHHRYTQLPGKDPELDNPKPASLGQWLIAVSGFVYWKDLAMLLVRAVAGRLDAPYITRARRGEVILETRLFAVLYLAIAAWSVAAGSTLVLTHWLLPLLVGQPFLRLFLMAEHTGCPRVNDMLRNTRTTLTHPLLRFLCWNMNYHVEHHVFPAVPFHALARTHREIRERIETVGAGYIAVNRQILAGIRRPAA